jgi:uncharacterized membrane protein
MGDIQTIARGDASHITQMRRSVAHTETEWRTLWSEHAGRNTEPPPVDFSTRMVVALFQGTRPTPGWDASITGARVDADALTVLVEEHRPAEGRIAAQVLVSPFDIVSMPRYDGVIRFEPVGQPAVTPPPMVAPAEPTMTTPQPAPPAKPAQSRPSTPSSTGLEPQMAGALAYLAGPLSGALLLIVERTSRFVRFHAWQALLGLGVLGAAAIGFLGLAFLMLIVSPKVFWALLWLAAILAAAWVVLWAVCLIQAYNGRRWKMPLAGAYAERLTNR